MHSLPPALGCGNPVALLAQAVDSVAYFPATVDYNLEF